MKFLFIVQGEGRGHLTQAMSMERLLEAAGHSVAGILVGKSPSRKIPAFFENGVKAPIHHFESVNFVPSASNKRPNMFRTFFRNTALWGKFLPSIRMVRRYIRASHADAVVNFYEMIGTLGWVYEGRNVPMICIGHQFLFMHREFKFPPVGYEGHLALNAFSFAISRRASKVLALSFRPIPEDPWGKITVVPPLLRPELRAMRDEVSDNGYILGYMLNAGFSSEVIAWHREHPEVPLHFFWDDDSHGKVYEYDSTLTFYYIDDKEFLRQMAGCRAYASTAGFESICEAMYLGKPLMMVPSHIEQECNAYDATRTPAAVEAEKFDLDILLDFIERKFVRDEGFRPWADTAGQVIVNELEKTVLEWKRNHKEKK